MFKNEKYLSRKIKNFMSGEKFLSEKNNIKNFMFEKMFQV